MEVYQMREKIADAYPYDKWKDKVAKMYDNQVIAIYYNFLETGVFEKKVDLKKKEEIKKHLEKANVIDELSLVISPLCAKGANVTSNYNTMSQLLQHLKN